ncbi:MAG: glycosyltransferase family 2 protein [Cypionkella sp.]|nr:glycosyltransferase family 2 protein [Cypionkella sp.]
MSCVKDEGPFILEFVAHHLAIGFDRVMMASNNCSDGSDDLLDTLAQHGYVQHLRQTVKPNQVPQHAGYAKLRQRFGLDGVSWLIALDVDEFLHVSLKGGRVQDLTNSAPENVDMIVLNAKTFGTALGATWQPGRVCAQFQYRLAHHHPANGNVKTLTRAPQRFRAVHNHHMEGYAGDGPLQIMRADGTVFSADDRKPLKDHIRITPIKKISHALAHYNHYAIKTYDSFALRRARGRGAVSQVQAQEEVPRHSDDYFAARMDAPIFDDAITTYAPQVIAKMAQMLAHPDINAAQVQAEAHYRSRLQSLDFGLPI